MKPILFRYLIPTVVYSIIALFLWIAATLSTDGFLPFVFGILFFIALIGTIPFKVYRDYKMMVRYINQMHGIYVNDGHKQPSFYIEMAGRFSSQFGVPEFIANRAVKYAKKKFV